MATPPSRNAASHAGTGSPRPRCIRALPWLAPLLLAWLVCPADEPPESPRPEEAVERLHAGLLAAMHDGEALEFQGRYAAIAPVVEATHDFASIARLTLQPGWNRLEDHQRAAASDALRHLSTATYASRFARYGGERFEILEDGVLASGQARVLARLTTAAGREIGFEYLLVRERGVWRIINILVDGVSDLALKRAEYGRVLAEEGFDELLGRLESQALAMAGGPQPERP